MEFGKNKTVAINVLIAVLGCIFVVTVHYFGYKWYMDHFTPRSRGVGLGFVMFYMRYIIIPIIFLSAFIKLKHSAPILSVAFVFMFYTWYGTNPLRVMLMFGSSLSGYAIIIFAKKIKKNIE
ncbi:Uncharacterised protein [Escherichia coli]|uniref:hypothetical protein n=1 Tax=Escherichia coli TaxID=562 RepID=UPI001919D749|nr:hypothetical protein [Escherichia coli]CAD6175601.1 Uncharacterised protein [Escherichia coli]